MMAGGIVLTSLAPVAMIVAAVGSIEKSSCQLDNDTYYGSGSSSITYRGGDCSRYDATIYGGLVAMVAFLGVGIPMIVIGAKREPARPAGTAAVTPWASTSSAGLSLRLRL
jgi:hypothetical protein